MSKWRRRTIGLAVVGATATLAWAAAGNDGSKVAAVPRIIGIRHGVGSANTGTIQLVNNDGSSSFTVKDILYSCGNPGVQLLGGSGGTPFTIGAGSSHPIVVECPAGLGTGLHRCTFTARDMTSLPVASFDGFCETIAAQKLTANPPSVTFANAQVGVATSPHTITLQNTDGSNAVVALQLQVDDDNFLVGTPCQNSLGCDSSSGIPAGGSAAVDVLCKPLSMGTHTGHLFLVGSNGFALAAPIDLSCATGTGSGSGLPVLTVTPPNVVINGQVEVAGGSASQSVALRNAGSGMLTIQSLPISDDGIVGAGSDWAVTISGQCATLPCDLGGGQELDALLAFDPSGFNSRHAQLVVNYSDPMGTKQQTVDLDGFGTGATLELIAGSSLEFGTIPLATASMPLTFTLRNQGNRPTTATFMPSPLPPYTFMMSATVMPGQQTVTVGCQAAAEIDSTETLTISGSDAPAVPDTVALHCNVKNTLITATPSAIDIHEVRTGTTPASIPITINRVGSGSAIMLDATPDLVPPDSNLSIANLTATMTPSSTMLSIDPQVDRAIATGTEITISPTVGQPFPIPVSGSVVTASFVHSDTTPLGTFCVGQPTSSTSVSFTSTGTSHILITSVGLQAGAASAFTAVNGTPTTYPTQLDPGNGKATVVITPKRATAAGSATDNVVWNTDAGSATTPVTVSYIADGGAIAPAALDFGDTAIRLVADNDQQVTLQNCSTTPLELIEPDVPAPFAITDAFPTVLGPADAATFSIAFRPTETGRFDEQLTVASTDGTTFMVRLVGTGISGGETGGDDTGDDPETSFYACGCSSKGGGDPLGVLAVAIASMCGFVARRKRRRHG